MSSNFIKNVSLGVGWFLRTVGNSTTPTVFLEKDGEWYKFTTESTFKTTILRFKLGEEFDEDTLDGRAVKSTMVIEGNKLIQTQKMDKVSTIVREFSDTECITTCTYGDVESVRKYKV